MASEKLTLSLIKNTYDKDDTKEVISNLLKDKKKSLRRKIFSLEERYGVDSPFLKNRIAELEAAEEELNQFLESINSDEYEFKIECPIHIEKQTIQSNKHFLANKLNGLNTAD